jgi:RHS repeat-associated protein
MLFSIISLSNKLNNNANSYRVGIRSTSDYSPFGVQLDGRTANSGDYRYGFNSMEKDDEIKGAGNSYDFGARMYDARVGRWLSTDSKESTYPGHSPFNYALNSPLLFKDIDGNDAEITITQGEGADKDKTIITYSTKVYIVGKGATPEYIKMLNDLKDKVYKPQEVIVDGETYIVKLDVQFIDAEKEIKTNPKIVHTSVQNYIKQNYGNEAPIPTEQKGNSSTNAAQRLPKGDNVLLTGWTQDGKPATQSFAGPKNSQAFVSTYGGDVLHQAYASLHEVLHLLGLSDRVINKKSQPGWEDDIMSTYTDAKANLLIAIDTRHYENFVKIALKIQSQTKKGEKMYVYSEQGGETNADAKVDSTVPPKE